MNFREPKLTRLASGAPCHLNVDRVCIGGGETTVWCHSNLYRHGKGKSIKAHDCFGATGCYACHAWLDQGKASRDEKEAVFMRGLERTLLWLWREGKIKVA